MYLLAKLIFLVSLNRKSYTKAVGKFLFQKVIYKNDKNKLTTQFISKFSNFFSNI